MMTSIGCLRRKTKDKSSTTSRTGGLRKAPGRGQALLAAVDFFQRILACNLLRKLAYPWQFINSGDIMQLFVDMISRCRLIDEVGIIAKRFIYLDRVPRSLLCQRISHIVKTVSQNSLNISSQQPPASINSGAVNRVTPVTVEPFQFSSAQPVADEWSY